MEINRLFSVQLRRDKNDYNNHHKDKKEVNRVYHEHSMMSDDIRDEQKEINKIYNAYPSFSRRDNREFIDYTQNELEDINSVTSDAYIDHKQFNNDIEIKQKDTKSRYSNKDKEEEIDIIYGDFKMDSGYGYQLEDNHNIIVVRNINTNISFLKHIQSFREHI